MISLEQIKDLQQRVETLGRCIDVEGKRADVAARQERTLAADFWDDPKEAEKFLKELSGVKFWVTGFDKVAGEVEDLNVLLELEDDDIDQAYASALESLEALELRNMLGEEGDNLGAVLTINSGAGGTEANDWSAMLYTGGEAYFSKKYSMHIVDRVGGGDSFGGGLSYSLLWGDDEQKAINFAVAASCLKHSIEGDYNFVSVDEVKALAGGSGSGRVQR